MKELETIKTARLQLNKTILYTILELRAYHRTAKICQLKISSFSFIKNLHLTSCQMEFLKVKCAKLSTKAMSFCFFPRHMWVQVDSGGILGQE